MMNEFWGKVHFWGTLVCMNMIFFPMFLQGMAGMHRRGFDGGATYDLNKPVIHWNTTISHGRVDHGAVPDSVHYQFLLEHQASGRRSGRIRGTRRRWNGRRLRRRRTGTLSSRSLCTAARMNTACPGIRWILSRNATRRGREPTRERMDTDEKIRNPKFEIRTDLARQAGHTRLEDAFRNHSRPLTQISSDFAFLISDLINHGNTLHSIRPARYRAL